MPRFCATPHALRWDQEGNVAAVQKVPEVPGYHFEVGG
ncbi:hypothetical protein Z946_3687 [Sulfitobacter noctilucicola]|nr:hypothetical protein Z946_3687 [Sulfitobacter noctilucicola]